MSAMVNWRSGAEGSQEAGEDHPVCLSAPQLQLVDHSHHHHHKRPSRIRSRSREKFERAEGHRHSDSKRRREKTRRRSSSPGITSSHGGSRRRSRSRDKRHKHQHRGNHHHHHHHRKHHHRDDHDHHHRDDHDHHHRDHRHHRDSTRDSDRRPLEQDSSSEERWKDSDEEGHWEWGSDRNVLERRVCHGDEGSKAISNQDISPRMIPSKVPGKKNDRREGELRGAYQSGSSGSPGWGNTTDDETPSNGSVVSKPAISPQQLLVQEGDLPAPLPLMHQESHMTDNGLPSSGSEHDWASSPATACGRTPLIENGTTEESVSPQASPSEEAPSWLPSPVVRSPCSKRDRPMVWSQVPPPSGPSSLHGCTPCSGPLYGPAGTAATTAEPLPSGIVVPKFMKVRRATGDEEDISSSSQKRGRKYSAQVEEEGWLSGEDDNDHHAESGGDYNIDYALTVPLPGQGIYIL